MGHGAGRTRLNRFGGLIRIDPFFPLPNRLRRALGPVAQEPRFRCPRHRGELRIGSHWKRGEIAAVRLKTENRGSNVLKYSWPL